MATVGLVPLAVMAVQGYYWASHTFIEHEKQRLHSLLGSRLGCVEGVCGNLGKDFLTAGRSSCAQGECGGHAPPAGQAQPMCHMLNALTARSQFYEAMAVFNPDWSIRVQSAAARDMEPPPPVLREAALGTTELLLSEEVYFGETGAYTLAVQGVLGPDRTARYFTVGKINLSRAAQHVVRDGRGQGESGKLYVVTGDGRYIMPPPGAQELMGQSCNVPEALQADGRESVLRYRDWRGVPVFGAAAWFPQLSWYVVAEIDEAEAFAFVHYLVMSGGVIGLITLSGVLVLALRSSRRISLPLRELARVSHSIAQGQRAERVPPFEDRETREVGEAFNRMLDQLEVGEKAVARSASLAAVGELSSSIVHEMRNPLSTIRINLQGMARKLKDDAAGKELAHLAIEQAGRLEAMLSDLLYYGKPLELKCAPVRFSELGERVGSLVTSEAEEKEVEVVLQDHSEDELLEVDAELVTRALTNLTLNAIQWSPPRGRVVIEAVPCETSSSWLCITVRDSGPGIPPSHLARLFQPFFTTRREGTGLGLANVRKIVDHHGGTVFAGDAEDNGAVFTIQLPIRRGPCAS